MIALKGKNTLTEFPSLRTSEEVTELEGCSCTMSRPSISGLN